VLELKLTAAYQAVPWDRVAVRSLRMVGFKLTEPKEDEVPECAAQAGAKRKLAPTPPGVVTKNTTPKGLLPGGVHAQGGRGRPAHKPDRRSGSSTDPWLR
jgi:hypothetical protein